MKRLQGMGSSSKWPRRIVSAAPPPAWASPSRLCLARWPNSRTLRGAAPAQPHHAQVRTDRRRPPVLRTLPTDRGEAQIAHEELQKLVDTPVGPLRVNMPADFGTDFLAESFMEFSCAIRTSPSISTSPADHAQRVFPDLRRVHRDRRTARLDADRARLLGMLPAYLYASREYLEKHGASIPATSPATSASSSARKALAASRAGR